MSSHFSLPEKSTRSITEFDFLHDPNDKSSKLGVGSFATVKLAREKKSGKLFALKIVNISPMKASASDIHNLKVEITVHKRLDHPNIIKFHDYIQADPFVYIILDYAEHGNLYTYLHRKKYLSDNEIFKFFHQTCLAMDYLHKNNVMHRDIKPENLILDKNFNLKVCDFGWSTQNITEKRTTFCGTYEYMAPEIVHKSLYDYRIDIWSLGVLLFELIHREAPYKGRSLTEITKSLSVKTINFSSSCNPDAKDLILKILRVNPSERLSMQQIFNHPWVQANLPKEPQSPQIQSPVLKNPAARPPPVQVETKKTQVTAELSNNEDLTIGSSQQVPHFLPCSQRPAYNHRQDPSAATVSLTALSPANISYAQQPVSQPTSLTNLSCMSQNSLTPSSAATCKAHDAKRYKIFSHESPAKENAIQPIKSPSIGQLTLMASGNLTSRDKENKDFMSFAGMCDLRRKENPTSNHSFVNLRTITDNYPQTATHLSSKGSLIVNRQQSENMSTRQTGTSLERRGKKGIFENSHLSPSFKLKLNDIMNQLSINTATRYESSSSTQYASRSPSSSINSFKSFGTQRTASQQHYQPQYQKENPYKFPIEVNTESQRDFVMLKDLSSNKLSSPASRIKSKVGLSTRSHSTINNLENKYNTINAGSSNPSMSEEPYINHPRGPKYNKGDENIPSLTGSFSGSTLPSGMSSRHKEHKQESGSKLDYSSSAKNLRELDVNSFQANKVDDEHPTLNLSFNQFYKGIEAKKKIDIGRGLMNKEN